MNKDTPTAIEKNIASIIVASWGMLSALNMPPKAC